jgi:autotransporter-associated beta strand protein
MTSFTTPPNITSGQSLTGNDTGTVTGGSSVTVSAGTAVGVALAPANPVPYTGVTINNAGLIQDTNADGRAINVSGTPTGVRIVQVTNAAGATITATDDAIRVNSNLVAGSTVSVDNAGTISSTAPDSNGGQGIDFNAITTAGSSVVVTNRATGTISSANNDAIRPGQGGDVENYGQILSNAAPAPTGQPSADGVDFQDGNTGTLNNHAGGTISGARHGIAGGTGTTVAVTNEAGATITGRNGSGVGLDGSGTVVNRGTISGTVDATSARGDGDGVDIDLTGDVTNYGTIQGLGAKGADSGGRTNAGEGLSLGGGTVANHGAILSAATDPDGRTANMGGAIVVNDDANADRSGNASTTITNYAGASITGANTYAIRLENKGSDAVDTDRITNFGTITGNGSIPDPTATVTYVAPAGQPNAGQTVADPNSVGVLDGATYTGTGSARFIRGDGSAIQMGEGADVLDNYGTIVGNSGRAVNLEGGDDTLDLHTGSTVTGRLDGGAGTDTLNLSLDDRTGADAALGPNSGSTTGTLSNVVDFEVLGVQSGAWTIADAQGYAAGATVAAGARLQVGDGGTAGSLAADIVDNGSLTFDRTDAAAYGGRLTGAGTLTKQGSGTLSLTNANAGFSGAVSLSAGTLDLAQATSAGTGSIAFAPNVTATLQIEQAALTATGAGTARFANTIAGFAAGDTIDIRGIGTATASFDSSTDLLTLVGPAGTIALQFSGTYSAADVFAVATDNNGGTNVTLGRPASPPTPTIPSPAPAVPSVALDPAVSYTGGIFTLTGTAASATGIGGVEVSAVLDDGSRQDLGAATLNGDGTFTFSDAIGAHQQSFLQATLTDGAGQQTVSGDPGFSLAGDLDRGTFGARQTVYAAGGSDIASTSLFRADGSRKVDVQAGEQTLHSDFFDTFQNHAAPSNTFVFDPGHGLDVVNQFRVDGTDHDTLSFKGSDFGNDIAAVLQNAHNTRGGVVILDPTSGDTVKLAGVTKAHLVQNQSDFTFHA